MESTVLLNAVWKEKAERGCCARSDGKPDESLSGFRNDLECGDLSQLFGFAGILSRKEAATSRRTPNRIQKSSRIEVGMQHTAFERDYLTCHEVRSGNDIENRARDIFRSAHTVK